METESMWKIKLSSLRQSFCLACLCVLALLLGACQETTELSESKDKSPWLILSETAANSQVNPSESLDNSDQETVSTQNVGNRFVTETISEANSNDSLPLPEEPKETSEKIESEKANSSSKKLEAVKSDNKELSNINADLESEEVKELNLNSLPKRNLLQLNRLTNAESELRQLINDERDKVGLAPYFDNPGLTRALETQLVYNMHYLLAKKFTTGPDNALILALHSEKAINESALSSYFSKQITDNEVNRIALIGDGMDQISLLLLYCERQGDDNNHHYVFAAMPWNSAWATEMNIQKLEPEVNSHLVNSQTTANSVEK